MNKISKYEDFLLENQFQQIIYEIFKLVENNSPTMEWDFTKPEDKVNVGDTITWDVQPTKKFEPIKDEEPIRLEWEIEKQTKDIKDEVKKYLSLAKSKASKFRTGLSKFKDYLNQGEEPVEFDIKLLPFDKIKSFIQKLDKEQVKKYFDKFVQELKELPYNIKKDLLIKLSILIFSITQLPINKLITDSDIVKEPVLKEVKISTMSQQEKETTTTTISNDVEETETETATGSESSFKSANELVSFAEGGYTENTVDAGNYTGPGKSGHLIGTNHGIAAFTLIKTNVKPTSNVEIKALKQCYGHRYEELCGKQVLSFGEQWRLDQKFVNKRDIGVKWKNIMKALSKETATKIYENEYWNPQGFQKIKSQPIANILYDACVNQGPGVSKKVLVYSMDDLGYDVDGVDSWDDVHSKLTPHINKMDENGLKKLHKFIKNNRLDQYLTNADADEREEFGEGWENRLEKPINTFT
jgi:lysozyme family protein